MRDNKRRAGYKVEPALFFLMLMLIGIPSLVYGRIPGPVAPAGGAFEPELLVPSPEAGLDDVDEDTRLIIARLNEKFGGRWSFRILYHQLLDEVAVVMGELTAGDVTKQQFGSAALKSGESDSIGPVEYSIGEALKAATTEAFKNAAVLFGIPLPQYLTSEGIRQEHGSTFEGYAGEILSDEAEEVSLSSVKSPSVSVLPIGEAAEPEVWFDPKNTRFVGTPLEPEIINTQEVSFNDYRLEATRITTAPRLDGYLDDPVWKQAPAAAGFRQMLPSEGHLDTERTEVRVLYDENTLYFGIMCYDREPDKIVATEMRRDQNVDDDDNFEMAIAPYGDKGDSYYFITNPLGSRRDALVGTGVTSFNPDWNATWQCYGKRHSMGWSLEIAIPFRNFRFNEHEQQEWAVNFGRHVKRTRGAAFWVPIGRADGGFIALYKYSKGGRIVGMRDIKPGRTVEVLPYTVLGSLGSRRFRLNSERIGYDFKRDFGGDLKWGITSGITADATINPDFAQISADDQVVNLTRFEFQFNEKRPFFLEGIGTFSFGGFFTQPQIFFSRRIGAQLFDGSNVRILHGEKISGKIGRMSFGLLNVQTEETPWTFTSSNVVTVSDTTQTGIGAPLITARDSLAVDRFPQLEPETHWSVFRLKQPLFARSSIGVLATLKEPEDKPDGKIRLPGFKLSKTSYNRVIGVDTRVQFNRSQHEINLIVARSWVPRNEFNSRILANNDSTLLNQKALEWAGTVSHSWQNAWFSSDMTYTDVRAGFFADAGFVPRQDIRQAQGSVGISHLLRKWGIRTVGSSGGGFGSLVSGSWVTNHRAGFFDPDLVESWDIGTSPGLEFENGTRLNFNWSREFDRLKNPTNIASVYFPAGAYTFDSFGASIFTDRGRPLALQAQYSQGDFYNARRRTIQSTVTWKPTYRARIALEATYNRIKREQPPLDIQNTQSYFDERLIPRLRLGFSLSTDMFISAILQMNTNRNTPDDAWHVRTVISNLLLAYTMQQGHTFLLAYNGLADDDFNLKGRRSLRPASQTIVAKFSYQFNL